VTSCSRTTSHTAPTLHDLHAHAMPNVPPHTPLRRISHGSLYALSRSQSRARGADPDSSTYDPSAPSALAFLGPALAQLADEAEVLAENAARQYAAADALRRFNEGFAAYLYATQMNMFGAYFPQVRAIADHT
jgi:DASH complex subunit DAM1